MAYVPYTKDEERRSLLPSKKRHPATTRHTESPVTLSSGSEVHETDSTSSCSCPGWLTSYVPIEVLLIGYTLSRIVIMSMTGFYMFDYASHKYGNPSMDSLNPCGQKGHVPNKEQAAKVQSEYVQLVMVAAFSDFLVAVLPTVFLGPAIDRLGRRIGFVLPLLGTVARGVVFLLVVGTRASVYYIYIGTVLEGLGGGFGTFFMTSFSAVADITEPGSKRALRICIAEAVQVLASSVAGFSAGHWRPAGYTQPLACATAMGVVTLIYALWFWPETRFRPHPLRGGHHNVHCCQEHAGDSAEQPQGISQAANGIENRSSSHRDHHNINHHHETGDSPQGVLQAASSIETRSPSHRSYHNVNRHHETGDPAEPPNGRLPENAGDVITHCLSSSDQVSVRNNNTSNNKNPLSGSNRRHVLGTIYNADHIDRESHHEQSSGSEPYQGRAGSINGPGVPIINHGDVMGVSRGGSLLAAHGSLVSGESSSETEAEAEYNDDANLFRNSGSHSYQSLCTVGDRGWRKNPARSSRQNRHDRSSHVSEPDGRRGCGCVPGEADKSLSSSSRGDRPEEAQPSDGDASYCASIVSGVQNSWGVYFRAGDMTSHPARRQVLALCLLSFLLTVAVNFSKPSLETVFFMTDLCWNALTTSRFTSAWLVAHWLCILVLLHVLQTRLHVHDVTLAMVGCASGLAALVVFCLALLPGASGALANALVYASAGCGSLARVLIPMLRSMSSAVVNPDEQGALFASYSCVELAGAAVFDMAASQVYKFTVDLWKGIIFVIFILFLLVVMGLLLTLSLIMRRHTLAARQRDV